MAVEVLPGDVELARRAAGGDGAAFVRLYDRYSGEVFAAALASTGCVERAALATQVAFLTLLRRPPAMAAPQRDVAERLRAIALGPGVEAGPLTSVTGSGSQWRVGAGWLRSETIAKASARFDSDWTVYLTAAPLDGRSVGELARAWDRDVAAELSLLEGVRSERPVAEPVEEEPARTRGARFRTWRFVRRPRPSGARTGRTLMRSGAGAPGSPHD